VKLGKYIQNLLQENETVIVPGFGAFVLVYKSAEIDEQSDEIKPPTKAITFNPKIRNNDGLLVDAIANKEGISYFEALKKIEYQRDEIIYQLDKGEKVTLENAGVLFLDKNNEIQFEPSAGKKLFSETFGLEETSLKDEPEPVPEEKPVEEGITEIRSEEPPEEHISETQDAEPQPEKEPEPVTVPEPLPDEPEKPAKKKTGWLWFLLILIPIIAAGIFILLKDDVAEEQPPVAEVTENEPPAEEIPAEEETSEPLPVSGVDSVQTDSVETVQADSIQIQEITIDSAQYVKPDTSMFYLVGGSFKEAKNANKYFRKLENDGYEPFHLGKQGSFYIVGIDIFDNEIEAYGAQYNFLDKFPDSGVWVFIPE
jgi:nucleoid DNA-binding protein